MNCPLCGEALAERGFFCKACAAQVRCKNCRELLEPAALACVECGTRVGAPRFENPGDGASLVATTIQPHRNTLSYQETKNDRTFHASLTDTAMEGLGEVLGDFFVQRGAVRTPNQVRPLVKQDLALQPPPTQAAESANRDAQPATVLSHAADAGADKDRILRIFHPNGDTLELIDNRLKAKSGSDFLRRLTYLFLYAQELHGRLSVPSDQLRAMLESGKIWDGSGNARRWIAKRVGLASEGEDRLKLNAKGREEAVKTLNDALDPTIEDEWNPDKKTPRKLGPRKKA
jgi:hypothetical protein